MFKVGDKVVCAYNTFYDGIVPLSVNKIYEVFGIETNYIWIINDLGHSTHYMMDRFILLSEYRVNLIDEILT